MFPFLSFFLSSLSDDQRALFESTGSLHHQHHDGDDHEDEKLLSCPVFAVVLLSSSIVFGRAPLYSAFGYVRLSMSLTGRGPERDIGQRGVFAFSDAVCTCCTGRRHAHVLHH
eukprot:TRINITY_DN63342_c0_g1_i1.p2 TRINITY_DN63342_c0_g1~~TRINITY_DN63342_c0_g1_i1.p2  ORF type:complete len:113 (-),score=12.25 TRINITY_DN63342_c0_g1_i1:52-390(-)